MSRRTRMYIVSYTKYPMVLIHMAQPIFSKMHPKSAYTINGTYSFLQ